VLSEVRLPAPDAVTGPLARTGPVGVTVVSGAVHFGAQAIPAEGIVVQHPGDTRRFTNSGPGPARLLTLTVTPAWAAPVQLPRAGDPLPALRVAFAAAAGLVGLGVAIGRRRFAAGGR
jgi:hypothetical protein